MYAVKLDNHTGGELVLYDPRIAEKGYTIMNPDCQLKEGKSGSFIFDILPSHPYFTEIYKRKSEISLYEDGTLIYKGEVLNDESDFDNIKTVQTEGELSYLLDSVQPIKEYHNIALRAYLEDIVSIHNAQVDTWKHFTVGIITVTDNNDSLYRYSNYEKTKDLLEDKLIDRLGGYFRVRHENGVRYLDYLAGNTHQNTQTINFGVNLLDFKKYVKGEEIATVLIPLGKKEESEDDSDSAAEVEPRLTIASVNNGSIFLENSEAIAQYGRIVDTVIFDDVTTASALKSKGTAELAQRSTLSITLEINAFDLHILNPNIESIKVSDSARVISAPHGIDMLLPVTEVRPDIFNPDATVYVIGKTLQSLTDKTNSYNTKNNIQKVVEAYGYGQKIINNTTVVNEVKNNLSLFESNFTDTGYASLAYVNGKIAELRALIVTANATITALQALISKADGMTSIDTAGGGLAVGKTADETGKFDVDEPAVFRQGLIIKQNGTDYDVLDLILNSGGNS